jgi:hypothetical protein
VSTIAAHDVVGISTTRPLGGHALAALAEMSAGEVLDVADGMGVDAVWLFRLVARYARLVEHERGIGA